MSAIRSGPGRTLLRHGCPSGRMLLFPGIGQIHADMSAPRAPPRPPKVPLQPRPSDRRPAASQNRSIVQPHSFLPSPAALRKCADIRDSRLKTQSGYVRPSAAWAESLPGISPFPDFFWDRIARLLRPFCWPEGIRSSRTGDPDKPIFRMPGWPAGPETESERFPSPYWDAGSARPGFGAPPTHSEYQRPSRFPQVPERKSAGPFSVQLRVNPLFLPACTAASCWPHKSPLIR